MKDKYVVILAAGQGVRMNSSDESHSKVAYPILGKPLVNYVLDASRVFNAKETYVVVGFAGEATAKCVEGEANIVWQDKMLGTGYAMKKANELLKGKEGDVIILNGDTPLLTKETLEKIYHKHEKNNNVLTICSTVLANPKGYGRVVREAASYRLLKVIPHAELKEEEMDNHEINSGIYVVDNKYLQEYVAKLSKDNNKQEYYLSDIVKLIADDGNKVDAYVLENPEDLFNINDRIQLAYAAKVMRKRVNHRLMLSGVSIEDPDTAYISPDAVIGRDTVVRANSSILGKCVIGENNFIGPNSTLKNVVVGNNCKITNSDVRNVEIKDNEVVGPFEVRK